MSRVWLWGREVLPAVIITVVQLVFGTAANLHQDGVRELDALGFALLSAGPLLLVARRAYPAAVFGGVLAVTVTFLLVGYGYGPIFVALIVAFLTAATRGSRWQTYPFVPLGYLLMVWPVPVLRGSSANSWQIVGLLAWLSVLVAIAEGIRQRRAVLVARRQRAEAARANEQAERDRELARREQRATEERLTIARELHDVLAHSLSVINVQSSVALELLDRTPEQAATSLSAIKEASRDALGEMHALLRSIRAGSGAVTVPTSPTLGIGDLDALLGPARAAGLIVRSDVRGTPQRLPAVLDGAAARIVQESLTNVLRHAPGAQAVVTVDFSPGTLRLTVDDSPPSPSCPDEHRPPQTHGGSGITGMIERAQALGGDLTAQPRTDGGFRVHARLPIPDLDTDNRDNP